MWRVRANNSRNTASLVFSSIGLESVVFRYEGLSPTKWSLGGIIIHRCTIYCVCAVVSFFWTFRYSLKYPNRNFGNIEPDIVLEGSEGSRASLQILDVRYPHRKKNRKGPNRENAFKSPLEAMRHPGKLAL